MVYYHSANRCHVKRIDWVESGITGRAGKVLAGEKAGKEDKKSFTHHGDTGIFVLAFKLNGLIAYKLTSFFTQINADNCNDVRRQEHISRPLR
jgi:hypothetical protein